ncbi:hypothetical protein CsatA_012122 [Cannabis sativa]
MSVFLLPLDTCSSLESMMSKYWWNSSNQNTRGISWMSWKRLTKQKDVGGMGFRSLHDYNLSLLGKQGWRLLVHNQSLVSRVYKARYYPHGNFLTATLGSNPSFIWKSIFESQDIVKMGARIRIGPGTSTNVLHTPWLPSDSQPCITSSHPSLVSCKVSQLMKIDQREWDPDIITDLFIPSEAQLILGIPLSNQVVDDVWYWCKETAGFYSVKSAYRHIQETKGHWASDEGSNFWKKFWKIKVPPKVLHFAWRALTDCLATRDQLRIKHVHVTSACVFCNDASETTYHLFIECPFSVSCWNRSAVSLSASISTSFFDWFAEKWSRHDGDYIAEILMVSWSIWKARNNLIWNNRVSSAADVVSIAHQSLGQWLSAQSLRFEPIFLNSNCTSSCNSWSKPAEGMTKINVDGATFDATNSFGTGFIARDSSGTVILASSTYSYGFSNAPFAEIISIKEALSWIKDSHLSNVVIETDCLTAVQALQSQIDMPSMFGIVVKDCKVLLSSLFNVTISHVKRSANKAAHCLARGSCYWSDRSFSESTLPSTLKSIVIADLI